MKKLGVFGGTFDPIHNGHLCIAETVLEKTDLDEIVFMPSAAPPHKSDRQIIPFEHRWKMVNLAITGKPAIAATNIEQRLGGVSYTVITLEALKNEYRNSEIYLIIGSDSLLGLPSWKEPEKLAEQCRFIVFPRSHADLSKAEKRFIDKSILLDVPLVAFSSSEIRSKVTKKISITGLVPDKVERYIKEHRLYLSN
jgi:nicotinate-nucleotide adenylyltransferase